MLCDRLRTRPFAPPVVMLAIVIPVIVFPAVILAVVLSKVHSDFVDNDSNSSNANSSNADSGRVKQDSRLGQTSGSGHLVRISPASGYLAQPGDRGVGDRGEGGRGFGGRRRFRRQVNRDEYPMWEVNQQHPADKFTFARIRYNASRQSVPDGRWDNDFPDADWNLSYRLQELTSMTVDPNGVVLELTDPNLAEYPFIFVIGVRDLIFEEDEAVALRRYLLNGGFLMVDDFWAPNEWAHMRSQMKRVFPDREPLDLPFEHPIFHLVYDFKNKPQVPSIRAWQQGWTFEYWHGDPGNDTGPHFQGYFDDQGRLVALMCHNNDICDGWEREGENVEYFQKFSERYSYPLAINILMYAMTH